MKTQLGYGKLLSTKQSHTILANALAELDIHPFSIASVERYKKYMEKTVEEKVNRKYHAVCEALMAKISKLRSVRKRNQAQEDRLDSLQDQLSNIEDGESNIEEFIVEWDMDSLEHYEEEVPTFVLNKALQIKEKIPSAKFVIDSLQVNAVDKDPFLVVFLDKERYYIEVWDEPTFEAEQKW